METFPWKSRLNSPIKGYFGQNKFLSQKQVIVTQKTSHDRNKFPSQKQVSFRPKFWSEGKFLLENKFPSKKQIFVRVSVKETHFCHRKKVFLTGKVSVREKSKLIGT